MLALEFATSQFELYLWYKIAILKWSSMWMYDAQAMQEGQTEINKPYSHKPL